MVLVHVDYPRLRTGWVEERLTKASLGGRGTAFGREQEIDSLPGGIHGSIQISVLPLNEHTTFQRHLGQPYVFASEAGWQPASE